MINDQYLEPVRRPTSCLYGRNAARNGVLFIVSGYEYRDKGGCGFWIALCRSRRLLLDVVLCGHDSLWH